MNDVNDNGDEQWYSKESEQKKFALKMFLDNLLS